MLKTFVGGIHPKDMKYLSEDDKIIPVEPGDSLSFFMNWHIGIPSTPIVSVGDKVLKGQKIGEASGFLSSNIFSSVSGTVKSIENKIGINGQKGLAIVIENDRLYETVNNYSTPRDWQNLSKDEILEIIKENGIVGMGGAGFPTHVKLSVKDEVDIKYIICNGAECEPYITCDYRLMLERPEDAVTGMKIVQKIFPEAKAIFGIENNKNQAIKLLKNICSDLDIEVVSLKKKYPQGGERMLIKALTGNEINSKMLPSSAGCVVLNFSTLIAIADAVTKNIPLISRTVTVTGDAIVKPCNFNAPIGISAEELINAAGGFTEEPEKIISGGPMMGMAVYFIDFPISKTTSCLLCLKKDNEAKFEPTPCIRCGKCLDACPEHLMPIKLKDLSDIRDYISFEQYNGLECIACGSCSYVCPAKRRLSQSISTTKNAILAKKKESAGKKQ